jgi:hypothetical protein
MLRITPIAETAEQGARTNYRGVDLLIARANNSKFKAAFRRLSKPYKKQIDNETLDEATSEDILAGALAEGILVDWKNFVVNGEQIPYTLDNAKELLKNDPDLVDFVTAFSKDIDNYLETDEAEVKVKR